MNPAWHQKVPCAFWSCLHQNWSLDLEKFARIEEVSNRLYDLMSRNKLLLQIFTAKIEVAVAQPEILIRVCIFLDLEGWDLRLVQDLQVLCNELDLARSHLWVGILAFSNGPLHS